MAVSAVSIITEQERKKNTFFSHDITQLKCSIILSDTESETLAKML